MDGHFPLYQGRFHSEHNTITWTKRANLTKSYQDLREGCIIGLNDHLMVTKCMFLTCCLSELEIYLP